MYCAYQVYYTYSKLQKCVYRAIRVYDTNNVHRAPHMYYTYFYKEIYVYRTHAICVPYT